MTKTPASPAEELAEVKKLFGVPPVLRSESINDYDAIMARLTECLEPRDFIEQMLVKDLTDSTWEIMRYSRHKALAIERKYLERPDVKRKRDRKMREIEKAAEKRLQEAKEAKQAAPVGDAEQAAPVGDAEQAAPAGDAKQAEQVGEAGAPTELEWNLAIRAVVDDERLDCDDILNGDPDEFDHAEALQSSIKFFEQLDRLLSVSIARRNGALAQIDFYRQGLGQRLRRLSDEIIDAEFKETHQAAPSIAGPGDGAQ